MRRSVRCFLGNAFGQASLEYAVLLGIVGSVALMLASITGDAQAMLDTANYVIHHIGQEVREIGMGIWRMFAIGW